MSKKHLLNDFSFGFELEGTYDHYNTSRATLETQFNKLLNGEGSMHSDGSLRAESGYSTFEYSSPVIQFTPRNINMVIKFLDSLPSLHVKINKTCGFHTHISFNGITKSDAVWAMASMAIDGSYANFLKLGRTNLYRAPYAKPTFLHRANELAKDNRLRDLVDVIVDNEKYRSIRIHPQGTLEWRGPRTFLNTIKHSKNVAYFKKLTQFIMRINDSLDMDSANEITKQMFLLYANRSMSYLTFRETTSHSSLEKLVNSLYNRPKAINYITEERLEEIKNKGYIDYDKLIRNLIVNDVKITSPSALKFLMSGRYLKSFIQLVDVETFNNNIELIGEYNNLTPTFEYLLKNPGVNDSVLVLLTNKALTMFGHSSIKTFTYNAMLEMIKYNPRAFKVAVNKDLVATFGYDRAANLIRSLANVAMWSFKNSELYKDLLQSPNHQLVEDLFPEYNFQTNNILNTLIDTSDN